jgi:hypothetical protein
MRRLNPAARTAMTPQHRGSRWTAVIDKSHRAAVAQQNRLIPHNLLPSIRPVQIAQFRAGRRQFCEVSDAEHSDG